MKFVSGSNIFVELKHFNQNCEFFQKNYHYFSYKVVDIPEMKYFYDSDKRKRLEQLIIDMKPIRMDLLILFTSKSIYHTKYCQDFVGEIDAKRHCIQNRKFRLR